MRAHKSRQFNVEPTTLTTLEAPERKDEPVSSRILNRTFAAVSNRERAAAVRADRQIEILYVCVPIQKMTR